MGKYIGIDLGTTFSCAAYIDDNGHPIIIPNDDGNNTTPSAVFFEDGEPIVGIEAKKQSFISPKNYEQFVKRHMGERDYFFNVGDTDEKFTPEAVSAMILKKIKADAENHLGEKVSGVVITVPAYFNEAQKKATMDAGEMAGLNVLAIINEPTAAALAYGISKGNDSKKNVVVYDLGGGTFDVTVMEFDHNEITVLSTVGNRKLGGFDFDNKIIEEVLADAKEKGIDIESDINARQSLQLEAENAKKSLSIKNKASIALNISGKSYKFVIDRKRFEELIEYSLFSTIECMEDAVEEAGLTYSDIDKILLVGGSTRIPFVSQAIERETGISPSSEIHPDEAVAIGAAYHVLDIVRNKKKNNEKIGDDNSNETIPEPTKQYSFKDITSHGVGIVCSDQYGEQVNSIILPKNTHVPASAHRVYSTVQPYQEMVRVQVTQGEEEDLRYVTIIGTADISLEPREEIVNIDVTVTCDENSILHVYVIDINSKRNLGEIRIDRVSNLNDDEIESEKKRIDRFNIGDE